MAMSPLLRSGCAASVRAPWHRRPGSVLSRPRTGARSVAGSSWSWPRGGRPCSPRRDGSHPTLDLIWPPPCLKNMTSRASTCHASSAPKPPSTSARARSKPAATPAVSRRPRHGKWDSSQVAGPIRAVARHPRRIRDHSLRAEKLLQLAGKLALVLQVAISVRPGNSWWPSAEKVVRILRSIATCSPKG